MATVLRALVLLSFLLSLTTGINSSGLYYVRPTEPANATCPGQPCLTLDEYAENETEYFVSNIRMEFLRGEHELSRMIDAANATNVTLVGYNTLHDAHIVCDGPEVSLKFTNITLFTISGLNFSDCGSIVLNEVVDFQLLHIIISGAGIIVTSPLGESIISGSAFSSSPVMVVSPPDDFHLEGISDHLIIENSAFLSCGVKMTLSGNVQLNLTLRHVTIYHGEIRGSNLDQSIGSIILDLDDVTIHEGSISMDGIGNVVAQICNSMISNKSDATIRDNPGIYIWYLGYTSVYINNSEIIGHGFAGIDIEATYQSDSHSSVTVENSVVSNSCGFGLFVLSERTIADATVHVYINNSQFVGHRVGGLCVEQPDLAPSNTIIENTVLMSCHGVALDLVGGKSALLRNVSFVNVQSVNVRNAALTAVVRLLFTPNVIVVNCTFINNIGTPILAYKSNFTMAGTNTFVNNTGFQGGAMAFYENSHMFIQNHTHLTFKNNHARHVGGAIYIYTCIDPLMSGSCRTTPSPPIPLCFLLLNGSEDDLHYLDVKLEFINNTAVSGGSALYGGGINQCGVTDGDYPLLGYQFFADNHFTSFELNATSLITSDPSRVCLCTDEMIPDCLNVFSNRTVYPGETFIILAVVVGQNFGTVDGSVYSQFIPLAGNKGFPVVGELQQLQGTNHQKCAELHYSVKSENLEEVFVLTSSNIQVLQYPDIDTTNCLNESTEIYSGPGEFKGYISDTLLSTPIYINITLLPCPPGFMLDPAECVCDKQLQDLNISCNITTQTIHRSESMWINASFSGNVSNGVIINDNCPFEYCNSRVLDVNLDNPDMQCAFEHSGTLCGGCKPGLSLKLGSSQCCSCTNKYLALLIPFAVAGLALVFFIKILNLTVAQGTINGLIFYANIVWANQTVFFPTGETNPVELVLIAWLNLDLGIETCFFDGLNGYYKTWLQFAFPLYIWAIVALVIVLAHYSSTAAKIFGNNSVPVLATLVFLSYAKLLRTIIVILRFSRLEYSDGSSKDVWSYDGNIKYLGTIHTPLFIVAIVFLLLLWLPYMGILSFAQCLQKVTNYRAMRWFMKLKPFFDAYFGPLQDKHRYWVGFLLLVRGILFVIFATCDSPTVNLLITTATMFALFMYLAYIGHIYRKNYVTLLENSFIMNLGIFAVGTLYIRQSGGSQSALIYTSVGIALAEFIAVLFLHLITLRGKTLCEPFWNRLMHITVKTTVRENRRDYENLDREEEEPNQQNVHRMMFTYGEDGELVLMEATETY